MCCCDRNRSKRCARRDAGRETRRARQAERRKKRHEPSYLRHRISQVRVAQSVAVLIYFLYVIRHSSEKGLFTSLIHLLTFSTLFVTAVSLFTNLGASESTISLAFLITGDAICVVLQILTIASIFIGHHPPSSSSIWSTVVFSNILVALYIHTIVRTAILISVLHCQKRQPLPVSIPDEDPPAYPDSDADLSPNPNVDTFRLDEEAGIDRKGDARDAPVASLTTLAGPVVMPREAEESDDSDDGREDRPLLRF